MSAAAAAPASWEDSNSDSSASSSTPPSSPGPWQQFAAVAGALTNLFPVWVLGAAVWALLQPPAFAWFDSSYVTPALAVTMLGMGLTLTFEVSGSLQGHPRFCAPRCLVLVGWLRLLQPADCLGYPHSHSGLSRRSATSS